ncbi:hypothetical protein [Aeromicrobium sp.]|uniref:hypothetical protein n=1 Tax=Aeromicrobium sp. TaxID=1871063 RepID=UPI002FCC3E9E
MNRRVVRLLAFLGVLACGFALAPAAWAVPPPAPVITSPSTFETSDPIQFSGTGELGGTVAIEGSFGCSAPVLPDLTWSCNAAPQAIGVYNVVVSQYNAGFEYSPGVFLEITVVADTPDPPPPPPDPDPEPEPDPTPTPTSEPEPAQEDAPVVAAPVVVNPTPTPEPSPTPTPEPVPTPTAEPAPVPAPVVAPTPVAASGLPGAWDPTDHPREVLTIGVAAFALLSMVGPTGLAVSSALGRGAAGAAVAAGAAAAAASGGGKAGSVKAAKVKMSKFSGAGGGRGDTSRTWQLPGWERLDAWSLAVPLWLSTRSPLTARVLADGSYLRAIFSTGWGALVLTGGALGLVAAHQTNGLPIAPSVALTATLLVIAIFDATAGVAGVVGFLAGMLIWRSDQLGTATTIRSFLGLAALWFAIPLIAAATRPFRRTTVAGSRYAWDRLADTVIGTLTAGWAVQKTVGGMPGLSGLDLPIADHADRLALTAMAAVVARVLVEELAAWRYPLRLSAVESAKLPFAGPRQRILATGLRTVLFVFLSVAFIGNCWQLWVGAVLFVLPQLLSIYERSFPNSARLQGVLPRGILKVLVMLVIGSIFAKLVYSILDDPDSMLRNGFLLMTIPGLVLSALGLFGHDGPDPTWSWPRQALGIVILGAVLGLVLTGF